MKTRSFVIFFLAFGVSYALSAYEVDLGTGAYLDIPELWTIGEDSLSWYSPDRAAAVEVLAFPAGSYTDLDHMLAAGTPEGAEGDSLSFTFNSGEAALAIWTFPIGREMLRGWFLFYRGDEWEYRIATISGDQDFDQYQPFLLSILDSFVPRARDYFQSGPVTRFLTLSDSSPPSTAVLPIGDSSVIWQRDIAAEHASQDLIEREATVLATYAMNPDAFYLAWRRYYRQIFRDSYANLEPFYQALLSGPFPIGTPVETIATVLLDELQSFTYGSTEAYSDLLAPTTACASATGDCDSLALLYIAIMRYYGVDGGIILSQQALHALAGLNLPLVGRRFVDDQNSWIVAELTTMMPLGQFPERLNIVTDWVGFSLVPSYLSGKF